MVDVSCTSQKMESAAANITDLNITDFVNVAIFNSWMSNKVDSNGHCLPSHPVQ